METANLYIAILSCTTEGNDMCFWESESVGTMPAGETPGETFLCNTCAHTSLLSLIEHTAYSSHGRTVTV